MTAALLSVLVPVRPGRRPRRLRHPRQITGRHTLAETNHAIDPHTRTTINSVPPVNEYTPEQTPLPGAPTMIVRNSIPMLAPLWSVGKRGRGTVVDRFDAVAA